MGEFGPYIDIIIKIYREWNVLGDTPRLDEFQKYCFSLIMSHNICVFNLVHPFYRGLSIHKIYTSTFQKFRNCWVNHQCAQLTRNLSFKTHCNQRLTAKIKAIICQSNIIHTQYRLSHCKQRSFFYSLGWHIFMAYSIEERQRRFNLGG